MENHESYLELDKLFFEADNKIKDGFVVEAFETLNYILEQDTEYGKAYNHLGWIYETKYKNYAKAEECYRLALKYAPDYTAIYLNYSILLSTLEKYQELEKLLDTSLHIVGINKSKVWNEYAIMYEMQGKYDEAIAAYKESIRHSLVNEEIDRYQDGITRCRKKQELIQA